MDSASGGDRRGLIGRPPLRTRDYYALAGLWSVVALQGTVRYLNIVLGSSNWSWDLYVWEPLARDVASGVPLYTGMAVDNKPPLWELLTVVLIRWLPREALLLSMVVTNLFVVAAVYWIARHRYGFWWAVMAGLFVVGALPIVTGFTYKPHNPASLLVLTAFVLAGSPLLAGLALGSATMVLQYAGLALPAVVLAVRRGTGTGGGWRRRFATGLIVGIATPFAAVALIWGLPSLRGAIRWTFLAAVPYAVGSERAEPAYASGDTALNPLHDTARWADSILEVALIQLHLIVPSVLMAVLAVRNGRKTDELPLVAAAFLLATPLAVRAFDQYWLLSLPFFALLSIGFLERIVDTPDSGRESNGSTSP